MLVNPSVSCVRNMKTTSQEAGISRSEGNLKSFDCYNKVDIPCTVGITLVQDIPLPSDPKETIKKEADRKDGNVPAHVLAWLAEAQKHFAPKFGAVDIKELEGMISLYLSKVSSCISKCYVPNRAAKMKRCIGDILLFFNIHYREIPEIKKTYSTYLDKMTELMAYYIDMEIQASSRAKEAPQAIASKLTLSLYTFLDKSHDHILDSILKANNMNRNFWELCSLLFSGVLKETPSRILSDLTYVRYILVYKMWKRVVQGPEERKKVMTLAALRLKHPPQFVEKTRAGFLNGIIPKIPKKRPDVTTFLIQAKFDVKEKAKAFLKYIVESETNVMFVPTVPAIKTDIPLLVGHLPDFGPSPNLVKLEPPEIEDDDSQNVDISGSRLMNEVWTSVNHEASFREAIRMQNVTTFNRVEAKVAEKKKIHRVLKLRKGRMKNSVVSRSKTGVAEKSLDTVSCATIVVSDDSDNGNDLEKGVVPEPALPKEVKKSKKLEEKRERRSSKKSSCNVLQKGATPPPAIDSPKEPDHPTQHTCILTPSQIKKEAHDDILVDDDVILDLPSPKKCNDDDVQEGAPFESLDSVVTCTKAEEDNPQADQTNHDVEKTNRIEVLKEERQSPTKENQVNIKINQELLEHIRFSGDFHESSTGDQVGKSPESASREIENGLDTDVRGAKPTSSPEKRRKEDNILFDDEESSWSPSGGSQEFIRRVVTNFISNYSPDDEVDSRLIESNVPSGDEVKNQVVDDDFDLDDLAYGEKSTFESIPDPGLAESAPPAKRSRVEEAVRPAKDQSTSAVSSPARVIDAKQASHCNKPGLPNAAESQPAANSKESLHAVTLRYHHSCYLEQAKFRDLCTSFMVKPEDEVPSAYFEDPSTGRLTQGCGCEQCAANFTALCSNVKCLADFKAQTLVAMENEAAPDSSTNVEDLSQFEEKQVVNGDQDEAMGDFNGPCEEASVQLPFKKRKAIPGRDDGESQHSDASKEETIELRQWPDEYPSHTPTRMFSIAALEDVNAMHSAPPLSSSCMFENATLPHCAASTSAVPSSGGGFSFGQDVDYPQASQSTGGGFPPFSSVVPPETRPQPYYVMAESPIQDPPVAYATSQQSPSDPDFGRRHFRTPAELKATFRSGPSAAPQAPWTQDLVSVAYFTRNLTSSSSTPAPEPKTRSRKDSSRKSSKSSRKRK